MSKNDPKVNFHYGQENLKNIIENIVKYKLNSCDKEINKQRLNTITSNFNKLKNEEE